MISLRPYQRRTLDMLYQWFTTHKGNPCIVLPTGAGKSIIIGALCQEALENYPETRILMLTHVKELIRQNANQMQAIWPDAPLGIYSAGLNTRDTNQITFAGIQSVRNRADKIGFVDLVLIDEAHLINHKQTGSYRHLIVELAKINPSLRVIGLTATPYRLGHGMITDEPAIFHGLIEPTDIIELQKEGYLAMLRSKVTTTVLDTKGVHKRGGEYIESELQKAVDILKTNEEVAAEVITLAQDRKHWLVFCTGVEHALHMAEAFQAQGINAMSVTGNTPKAERDFIIAEYKKGNITCLCGANIFTTGFDYPDIDLIVMLRPTMSPGLYSQMAGRGLRVKSHTDHCLVLDFAGVVAQHGPITAVLPPSMAKVSSGIPMSKICPECDEIVAAQVRTCPVCGYEFPFNPTKRTWQLHDDDIMGLSNKLLRVISWHWDLYTSKSSGRDMLRITYWGEGLSDPTLHEYLPIYHAGYAGEKALMTLREIATRSGIYLDADTVLDLCNSMTHGKPPLAIEYRRNGRYYNVVKRHWEVA